MSRLVDIAKLNMGQSPPSSSYNDNGIGLPFYQGKTDFGFINPIPRKYCSSPAKIAKIGDILISVRAPVGPVNIADKECCIGRGVAAITSKTFVQLFIYFSLIYQEGYIASLGTGSTFKAINKSQLETVSIPDFQLPDQRKIAYVLSTVQKAIEQQDKLIRHTTKLKKALMQKLFTEGAKGENQKQTEIGLVPESWEVENLGLHSNIVTSFPTFAKASARYSTKEGKFEIHYLKVSDMNLEGNEISFITSNNTFYTNNKADFNSGFIKPASLVFPKRGAAIATNKKRITTKHSILDPNLIGVEPFEEINIKFLFYFFETFDLASLQDNNVIPQLNKHNVAGVKFPLPKIQEQELIVKTIDTISQKVNSLKTKKHVLSDLFKTLLHELMTGERRVNELEFEALNKEYKIKEQPLSMVTEK